jgi:hypothetical protein
MAAVRSWKLAAALAAPIGSERLALLQQADLQAWCDQCTLLLRSAADRRRTHRSEMQVGHRASAKALYGLVYTRCCCLTH